MTRRTLTEDERATLVNGLHSAAAQFTEFARTFRSVAIRGSGDHEERLATAFERQLVQTLALIDTLEAAHSIWLEPE